MKREKRISNIEQGISNDEVRNAGFLPTTCGDSGIVLGQAAEEAGILKVEVGIWVPAYCMQGFGKSGILRR